MNNEAFDKMIKDSIGNNTVTPSENVANSLKRKMLVMNIWFFHKTKVLLAILLLGTVSIPFWNTKDLRDGTVGNIALGSEKEERIAVNTSNVNKKQINAKKDLNNKKVVNEVENRKLEEQNGEGNKKDIERNLIPNPSNQYDDANQYKTKEEKIAYNKREQQEKQDEKKTGNLATALDLKRNIKEEKINFEASNELKYCNLARKPFPMTSNIKANIVDYSFENRVADFDYVKDKGTFSLDAFLTPFNQLEVVSSLNEKELSSEYDKKEWDFYSNKGFVNSGVNGGIRLNYTKKNIVVSGGLKLTTLRDYKPMYKYEQINSESVLDYFDLTEISGVQIQDKDSAHYVFYTENNKELINRLEKDKYNTYKYVSIPLRIGYEFKNEKYSIIVQGGGVYSRLLSSKGTYLRKYNNGEEIDIYYNSNIETALLDNKNKMLKKNYFSFLAAVVASVKISNYFDVFGEVNYTKSINNITKQNYILNKKAQMLSANFGIRYYLKTN